MSRTALAICCCVMISYIFCGCFRRSGVTDYDHEKLITNENSNRKTTKIAEKKQADTYTNTLVKVTKKESMNQIKKIKMIYIPAGSFLMGSDDYGAEQPQHTVTLSDYWIGKYEVTRGEYWHFINFGGYSNSSYWSKDGWRWIVRNGRTKPDSWAESKSQPIVDDNPVVGVTYYEAEAFCKWAGGHLPTEAQWEKAARGTDGRIYPWGNEWDESKRVGTNIESGTMPVGSVPTGKSPYGCMDMAGNVLEWCQDWRKPYYKQTYDKTFKVRVLRGGSGIATSRCACREWGKFPYQFQSNVGFRLVR